MEKIDNNIQLAFLGGMKAGLEAFVEDMESDNEIIPMFDDILLEVNTPDDNLQLWWKNEDFLSEISDLLEECKRELCL